MVGYNGRVTAQMSDSDADRWERTFAIGAGEPVGALAKDPSASNDELQPAECVLGEAKEPIRPSPQCKGGSFPHTWEEQEWTNMADDDYCW